MAKLSETRDTQDNKDNKSNITKEAIELVITDIQKVLAGNRHDKKDYINAFNDMLGYRVNDSFEAEFGNYDIFWELEILTKFYQIDEAKDEIITAFAEFFKNIIDTKQSKTAIVIRYENYLKAIQLLEHSFYFQYDYFDNENWIIDKFDGYADHTELTKTYTQFKSMADEYFKPFKEQKERYDLLNNTQAIRTKFTDTLVLKADMYQIVGVDKNKKATLANKIYKYFNPNDKNA
ncbi:hypothetical protein [Campylobacter sp. RM16192]|uniref:hypothetical protein n=1 Tax=Campylobacter sp. RM16192 TaxID=1660080 RepID=UPI0014520A5F|nr:hypothetical protein [Campylobacter sp. RM16192]QCD53471.1 hypothetical protein CDOMC_1892 [Campylobacter sp. RM16192]